MEDKTKMVPDVTLLSIAALKFLSSCNWGSKTHEERLRLVQVARELYPEDESL